MNMRVRRVRGEEVTRVQAGVRHDWFTWSGRIVNVGVGAVTSRGTQHKLCCALQIQKLCTSERKREGGRESDDSEKKNNKTKRRIEIISLY
jgi:hypothetical protein